MKIFRRYLIYIYINLYIHIYSIDAFLQRKNLAEKSVTLRIEILSVKVHFVQNIEVRKSVSCETPRYKHAL